MHPKLSALLLTVGGRKDVYRLYEHDRRARKGQAPYLPRMDRAPHYCSRLWTLDADEDRPTCKSARVVSVNIHPGGYDCGGRDVEVTDAGRQQAWVSDPPEAIHLATARYLNASGLYEACPSRARANHAVCQACMAALGGTGMFDVTFSDPNIDDDGPMRGRGFDRLPVIFPEMHRWRHDRIHNVQVVGKKTTVRTVGACGTFDLGDRARPLQLMIVTGTDPSELLAQAMHLVVERVKSGTRTLIVAALAASLDQKPACRKLAMQLAIGWTCTWTDDQDPLARDDDKPRHMFIIVIDDACGLDDEACQYMRAVAVNVASKGRGSPLRLVTGTVRWDDDEDACGKEMIRKVSGL